jgi:hypothetical protein
MIASKDSYLFFLNVLKILHIIITKKIEHRVVDLIFNTTVFVSQTTNKLKKYEAF